MTKDLLYQIALAKINRVGAKTGKTLVAYCGGVRAVFEEKKSRLLKIPGIGEQAANIIASADPEELARTDLDYINKHQIETSFYLDDDYPSRLKNYEDAPLLLYHKGAYNANALRTVAVVGTRQPTPYGISLCERLVANLKKYNVQIISGLAYGIDAIAHRIACQEGIENVAVMGTGMDQIYPASHRNLSEKIISHGALITEYPIKRRVDKENFPRRNRVIASMADVTVVVQSAKKGGSLITAEFANQYYKDVFAFPGRVHDSMSEGCNQLIKQNKAHLLESVADIGYIMRWELENKKEDIQAQLFVDLSKEEEEIVALIRKNEEVSIDELHVLLQKTLSSISALLLNLEMKGVLRPLPGSRYTLR